MGIRQCTLVQGLGLTGLDAEGVCEFHSGLGMMLRASGSELGSRGLGLGVRSYWLGVKGWGTEIGV